MNSFTYVILLFFFSMVCCAQDSTRSKKCVPELQPSFPGGEKALRRFVNENLKYPKSGCVEGTVFVLFVVNKGGLLSEIKVVKGLCDECDRNAIEVFKYMPKWIPVKNAVRLVGPVRF